jgi:hypothetical protein
MGKNLDIDLSKLGKKVECRDPEHKDNRSINSGDWWMEWPDFILRCEECHKRRQNINSVAEKLTDDNAASHEQLELPDDSGE